MKNISLQRAAQDLYDILKYVAIATDNLQRSTCKLSDVVCVIKHLQYQLSNVMTVHPDIKEICESRFTKMARKCHYAAFILSPTHKKSQISTCRLSPAERELGMDFIKSECPSLLPFVMKFVGNIHPFSRNSSIMYRGNTNSLTDNEWWSFFIQNFPNEINGDEFQFMSSLMTANASSSNLERIFSKFGLVHNEVRNRLGVQTASRLVYLHHTLNQKPS